MTNRFWLVLAFILSAAVLAAGQAPDKDKVVAGADRYSEEAQSRVSIKVENGNAVLILRPVARFQPKPVYKDAFSAQGYVLWFPRDKAGKVTGMHVGTGRMRDMLFVLVAK